MQATADDQVAGGDRGAFSRCIDTGHGIARCIAVAPSAGPGEKRNLATVVFSITLQRQHVGMAVNDTG